MNGNAVVIGKDDVLEIPVGFVESVFHKNELEMVCAASFLKGGHPSLLAVPLMLAKGNVCIMGS